MSWLDPKFRYRRSNETDIRRTISKERKRLEEAKRAAKSKEQRC